MSNDKPLKIEMGISLKAQSKAMQRDWEKLSSHLDESKLPGIHMFVDLPMMCEENQAISQLYIGISKISKT
jgi:hypothetical protein